MGRACRPLCGLQVGFASREDEDCATRNVPDVQPDVQVKMIEAVGPGPYPFGPYDMSPPSPTNSRQPYIVGSRCHAASSKHVLAVALGATENAAVVKALLADLMRRIGYCPPVHRRRRKALSRAVRDTFGALR